jgi:hypothetical protein
MALRIIFIVVILFAGVDNYAQSDPSIFLKNFFATIKEPDSAGFVKCFISAEESDGLVKTIIRGDQPDDRVNYTSHIDNKAYADILKNKVFGKLQLLADSLHINLKNTAYSDCKYQIIKDPEIMFTSLKGEIFFKENNRAFTLTIEEAIFINDSLKILGLGNIALLADPSALTKKPKKLTAFDSFKIEVKDVTIEEIVSEKEEPPPPPPPPPSKKTKRKK